MDSFSLKFDVSNFIYDTFVKIKSQRLSESYIGIPPENSLELVVKIIDVRYNKGEAETVLSRSEKLRGYSLLLNYVNVYKQEGHSLEDAIDLAVNRCIDEQILQDFLIKYGKEVRGMLYDDITIEKFAQIRGEERWEDGRQYGCEEMQSRMNQLYKALKTVDRLDDYEKSVEDENFQQQLFLEFGI